MTSAKTKEKSTKIEKAHCPTCNRQQSCDLHEKIYKPWAWSDKQGNSGYGGASYSLFQCRGCETVFTEKRSWDDQDLDHWHNEDGKTQSEANYTKETYPRPPSRPCPDWLDRIGSIDFVLHNILDETYKCYEENCFVLTAIGMRTALDCCFTNVQIDPGKSFQERLKELRDRGFIGETEHSLLTVLTDAGSAAAHRGWSPDQGEIAHLLDVLENFIHRVLVNGQQALAMKDTIPKPQKRNKTAGAGEKKRSEG